MTHVATLITNPAQPALDPAAIALAVGVLATAMDVRILDPGIAADIPFTPDGADDKAVAERLRTALRDHPIDVVVPPRASRRKKLFVADMDSTMIEQECIDELADAVGLKAEVAAITERAMSGELDFEPALRERVALIKGLPRASWRRSRRAHHAHARRPRAHPHHEGERRAHLRSSRAASPSSPAASRERRLRRAPRQHPDRGGRQAPGPVGDPILGNEAKLAALTRCATARHRAAGDARGRRRRQRSCDDRGGGPRRRLSRQADRRRRAAHARIDHGDLTALLYLQGYARAEFVEP